MAQDIESSAGTARTSGAQRRPPVDPLQQHRELRRAQRHRPLARLRPDEPSALQPLAEQAETLTVPIQHLDQVAAPAAKDEQMPGERILPQHLLRQHRKPVSLMLGSLVVQRADMTARPDPKAGAERLRFIEIRPYSLALVPFMAAVAAAGISQAGATGLSDEDRSAI